LTTPQGVEDSDELDEATLAVVIHGLLTSVSVISGGAITLRDSWDDLTEADRKKVLSLVIGQSGHVGGVLQDLLRGLPRGLVSALDGLPAHHGLPPEAASGT
jgi:hypothetical protein